MDGQKKLKVTSSRNIKKISFISSLITIERGKSRTGPLWKKMQIKWGMQKRVILVFFSLSHLPDFFSHNFFFQGSSLLLLRDIYYLCRWYAWRKKRDQQFTFFCRQAFKASVNNLHNGFSNGRYGKKIVLCYFTPFNLKNEWGDSGNYKYKKKSYCE